MKSTLKIAVPLVALVGVVFGVTFLNENKPPEVEWGKNDKKNQGGGSTEPPLRFFTSGRAWDPPKMSGPYREFPMLAPSFNSPPETEQTWSFELQNRLFQGVYEPNSDKIRTVQFWFENRNPERVSLQLKGISCTACSQGSLIEIPPELTRDILQHTALAALPLGPFNGYGVGLAGAGAQLDRLPRTTHVFKDNPGATYNVQGATNPDKWSPQWGILELGFRVTADPAQGTPKPLEAFFEAWVDGNTSRIMYPRFHIRFDIARAFEVWPPTIEVGRLDELATDKGYEFLIFSSARGPGSEFGDLVLTRSDLAVQGTGGEVDTVGFLEVKKVERIPEGDLVDTAERLAEFRKRAGRVRTAYRVAVVLHPRVGEHRMEIGAFDRSVAVAADGIVNQVHFRGTVRGSVWLDEDRNDIELVAFKGGQGTRQEVNLVTEKTGIELSVVAAECKPDFYTYELVKQPDSDGKGRYKLVISVKGGKQFGRVRGDVVLEVKGPTPQRIRIPVRSTASASF
jgi:hypothetical protein